MQQPRSKCISRWLSLGFVLLKIAIASAADINAHLAPVLTFFDVRVEMRGHAANVLRQEAEAVGEHPSQQTIVLQETARPDRFAALERQVLDLSSADGRDSATLSMGIVEDLIAPPDQRFTREFEDISTSTKPRIDGSANLYVITNLDIAASNLPQAELALHNLASAERQINGNRGVEILRQANHANHFNLISAWTGEAPFHAFAASVRALHFRQTIAPLLGSPYDERLYSRVY
jgi:quinol monooxygenase YgiN